MSVVNVDTHDQHLLQMQINFYMSLSQYTPISDRGVTLGSQLFDHMGIGVLENIIRLSNPALGASEEVVEASIAKHMNAQQVLVKQKYNDMFTAIRKLRSKFEKTRGFNEVGKMIYQAATSFVSQIRNLYLSGQLLDGKAESSSQTEVAEALFAYTVYMHVLQQRPDFYKPLWQVPHETVATIAGFGKIELWIWSMVSRYEDTAMGYFDKCAINLTNMFCAKYGHVPVSKDMPMSDISGILHQYIEKSKREAAALEQINKALFSDMLEMLYSIPASDKINNEVKKMLGIQILRTR